MPGMKDSLGPGAFEDEAGGHMEKASCPMCGRPTNKEDMVGIEPGVEPVCRNCADEYMGGIGGMDEPDPDRYRESAFDKHMDRILVQEHRARKVDGPEDNPLRRLAARTQDRPANRIRVGGRK